MAEVLPQLAPGDENARGLEETKRDRPDGALAAHAFFVAVGDAQLALLAQRSAQQLEVDRLPPFPAGTDEQQFILQPPPQIVGQDGGDAGNGVAGSIGECIVGAAPYPSRAERQRLDLIFREHQRRQQEAGTQHIADAGLALDFRTHGLQSSDVAIERAQGYARLARKLRPAHRPAVPAQHLQQVEQAVGSRHEEMVSTDCCQIVAAVRRDRSPTMRTANIQRAGPPCRPVMRLRLDQSGA